MIKPSTNINDRKLTVVCNTCDSYFRVSTPYDVPIRAIPTYCIYCGQATLNTSTDLDLNWQESICEEYGFTWEVLVPLYDVWLNTYPMGSKFTDILDKVFRKGT